MLTLQHPSQLALSNSIKTITPEVLKPFPKSQARKTLRKAKPKGTDTPEKDGSVAKQNLESEKKEG